MNESTVKGNLICNLWTDLIGPSVFLSEVASLLAYKLYKEKNTPMKILDLFSGSGALAVATLNAFSEIKENLSLVCIDKNVINFPDALKRHVMRLRTDIFELIGRNSSFFKQDFDIVVADPPHYLTLDLLYKFANDDAEIDSDSQAQDSKSKPLPFLQFLSDIKSLFVLYFAHKEQERLSFFIIRRLGMFWPQVYNLRIADEKIAICAPENYDDDFFKEKYFPELKKILLKDYQISDILILDKYNNEVTL